MQAMFPVTNAEAARLPCVTVEQIRQQHARNLPGLERMPERAESTGCKVSGFNADDLRARVADSRKRAGLE